jgi:ATPase subunit of ABC transporter with duplicated ATPase domains
MARNITREEVAEVREIKLQDIMGAKGSHVAIETINEALKKRLKVACIGGQGTGKSLLMKVILNEATYYEPERTLDEAVDTREFKQVNSDRIDYFVASAENAEELLDKIKERTGKDLVDNMIVITRAIDHDKGKYVKSIEEITSYDGVNKVNTLVEVKKDRFVKVNDISISR